MESPLILKLHGAYESHKAIHLVLDYLSGGDFYNRFNQKGFREFTVMKAFYRILLQLRYIHSKGVVHRDIKAENLIFRDLHDDTDVVIADFGLAMKMPADGSCLYSRCGTPGYVAPEVLNDVGYDQKIDMFSMGVLLYGFIYPYRLFRGNNC